MWTVSNTTLIQFLGIIPTDGWSCTLGTAYLDDIVGSHLFTDSLHQPLIGDFISLEALVPVHGVVPADDGGQ